MKPAFYKKFALNNAMQLQLVDRNGVFKELNTLKHEYDLQSNLYF